MIDARFLPQHIIDRNAQDVFQDILRLPDVERYNLYTMLKTYEMSMIQEAMGFVPLPILDVLNMLGAMSYAEKQTSIQAYYDSLHQVITQES